jgi:hypothetical protein
MIFISLASLILSAPFLPFAAPPEHILVAVAHYDVVDLLLGANSVMLDCLLRAVAEFVDVLV